MMAKCLLCAYVYAVCEAPRDLINWGKERSNMEATGFVSFLLVSQLGALLAQDLRSREWVKQCFPKLITL